MRPPAAVYQERGLWGLIRGGARHSARKAGQALGTAVHGLFRTRPLDDVAFRLSRRLLRRRMADEDDLADILETAYEYRGLGRYRTIEPMQLRDEWGPLLRAVAEHRPRTVLEIGTGNGGSLYTIARFLDTAEHIITVDLPGGPFGGGYPEGKSRLFEEFAPGTELHTIRGDSQNPETQERVLDLLDGNPIDFLYVDGDHTYEGVRSDYEAYAPHVAPGGLVAFDDLLSHERGKPRLEEVGVHRLWADLKDGHETTEFVSEREDARKKGLGLLRKPDEGIA